MVTPQSTLESQNVFVRQLPRRWKAKIASSAIGRGRARKALIPPTLVRANFHHIRVVGTTEFHDYETFGPNEHGTFGFMRETVLSTEGPSVTLLDWEQGFGGEERVEIDMTGSLNSSTGACFVQINVRFFEGATEGTTELEDSDSFQTIVPVGQTSNFEVHLANDEDDWATIRGSIGNSRF
jgi:hypothetical protein